MVHTSTSYYRSRVRRGEIRCRTSKDDRIFGETLGVNCVEQSRDVLIERGHESKVPS
jgi:hypothetical protein